MSTPPPQDDSWREHYEARRKQRVYPTEFVLRTLLGRYPKHRLDPSRFPGARMLDVSCGDGRNLGLLLDLGFRVSATELDTETTDALARRFPEVDFHVGRNNALPFADGQFDYLLACHTCYYLDGDDAWDVNLAEHARVLGQGGVFVGSVLAPGNFLVEASTRLPDGSLQVDADPFGLRDGGRVQDARSEAEVRAALAPHFSDVRVAHLQDDYYGLRVNAFTFVGVRP